MPTRSAQPFASPKATATQPWVPTAFTYDNAVSIFAYLASEDATLSARAEVLGEGLLYAQANNFPFNDGRFAQGYFVNVASSAEAYITPAAYPYYFYRSTVGDQAWAGMVLAQLYFRTRQAWYLTGALLVANWIVTNAYNTAGAGGYSFGTIINQYNGSESSPNGKSTEHNIDAFAFHHADFDGRSVLANVTYRNVYDVRDSARHL